MSSWSESYPTLNDDLQNAAGLGQSSSAYDEAEAVLQDLARVFFENTNLLANENATRPRNLGFQLPSLEAKYRALVEQIPAVVFMAYLDEAVGEAYVSPQIEAVLGFTQEEWLQDPVRWYAQIHADDKLRWSVEAADLFLSGRPLRSAYRVMSRDGRVIWFHCEAKMIRREDGRPWFIHGVGFDITDLKQTEEALEEERNVVTAILDTVGALVIVLDPEGRIVRFNRACERSTGYTFAQASGQHVWDLFIPPEASAGFRTNFEKMRAGQLQSDFECQWLARDGDRRLIAWSGTSLGRGKGTPAYVIATGIDITERKHLERAILEISEREQRRIGQDLHDGLGQHLTGIAFMTKVQEQKLKENRLPYAADAAKIVKLVNEAINKTRELARGLSPVVSESHGLMSALQQLSTEVQDVFGVSCRLQCDSPVLIDDVSFATHLYHISQEAVSNAIKHGKARKMHDESIYAERALRAGANGYIMKQEATEKVLVAVRQILAEKVYVSDRIANRMLQQYIKGSVSEVQSPIAELSDRELEVFRLIGEGHGTRKIAEELHLSVKTVESYQAHIKEKLSLKNGRELVQRAIQWSISEDVA